MGNSKLMKHWFVQNWVATTVILASLAGCASPSQPTRFYRLDGGETAAVMVDLKPRPGVVQLGVSPVVLAGYLDRPQIVERHSRHRLELYEFDQWAGSLQENLQSVVSERLQQQLKRVQVIAYPWPQSLNPQFELNLSISRFDRAGDKVVLQALWSLVERRSNQILEMQKVTLQEPFSGGDIEAGIEAANEAVNRLSENMASQIRRSVTKPE
ncbi:MAG: PqiC family protein [Candidatus Thiodiazotropha sp. L084R]